MGDPDVLVIGAGAAGLAASVALEEGGLRVLCLEARDRIGGRILTKHDPLLAMPVELGAEFIHGSPPELIDIANEGNLLIADVSFDSRTRRKGSWVSEREEQSGMWELLGRAEEHAGPDQSWAEFAAGQEAPERVKQAGTRYVEGFNAARAEVISVASIAQDMRAAREIDDDHQFRILNGYDRVPAALASRLRKPAATIRMSSPVRKVSWREGQVAVEVAETADQIMARAAVLTLPVGVLQAGSVEISPVPEAVVEAANSIAVGEVFRVTLHFAERFWDGVEDLKDAGFLFTDEEVFPTWWTSLPVRTPAITGWSAGPHAERLVGLSGQAIAHEALATLARITQVKFEKLRQELCGWHCHDWQSDPYARGAYSYARAGKLDARRVLAEPVANTLFFAGEASETEGHSGTVHGAIASGRRAARQVLAALRT